MYYVPLVLLLLLLHLFLSVYLSLSLFKGASHNNIAISLPTLLCFLGLHPFCIFFFFMHFFFYESQALHRQLCSGICYFLVTLLVLHMLFFGDAFGPAYYTIFWCFCIQLCSFLGGSNFGKCFQQATTLLFGRFRRSQQRCVQRMFVQQYVCVYAKYTLCVHTAVRPRNILRNIMH